jgi:hypothetical protein
MNLSRLIDLIAEVAAKRTAKEGKNEADKPSGTICIIMKILSVVWPHVPCCLRDCALRPLTVHPCFRTRNPL